MLEINFHQLFENKKHIIDETEAKDLPQEVISMLKKAINRITKILSHSRRHECKADPHSFIATVNNTSLEVRWASDWYCRKTAYIHDIFEEGRGNEKRVFDNALVMDVLKKFLKQNWKYKYLTLHYTRFVENLDWLEENGFRILTEKKINGKWTDNGFNRGIKIKLKWIYYFRH